MTVLVTILLALMAGVLLLRLISRKCPYCDHCTTSKEGDAYHCENGHCDNLFME